MLKITKLAEDVAKEKQASELLQSTLDAKINEFMNSAEIKELSENVENARAEYEVARENVLEEMKKQKQMAIKTEDGTKVSRSIIQQFIFSDEEKVIEYLEENNPDLVRKAISKTPAKKFLQEEIELGKEVEGFSVATKETLVVTIPKNG